MMESKRRNPKRRGRGAAKVNRGGRRETRFAFSPPRGGGGVMCNERVRAQRALGEGLQQPWDGG